MRSRQDSLSKAVVGQWVDRCECAQTCAMMSGGSVACQNDDNDVAVRMLRCLFVFGVQCVNVIKTGQPKLCHHIATLTVVDASDSF